MEIAKEMLEGFDKGSGKRITIDGETKNYPTYRIPLNYLIFNEKNGRIITEIAQYKALHPNFNFEEFKRNDFDGYRNLLKELVEQSSNDAKKSFYETKSNIEKNGQKEAGVILSDGTIVDGNRRFACLLELYQDTKDERFATFEATWFPAPLPDDTNKQRLIKEIEFNLQYNNDPIRKYSRIASLESFYYDTLCPSTKTFNKDDYCKHTGMKSADYDSDKKVVEIMLDYLDFIRHPSEFWIIKDEELDSALEQIAGVKFDQQQWPKIREVIYTYLTVAKKGDVSKNVRKLIDSANKGTGLFKEFKMQFYDEITHDDIKQLKNIMGKKFSNPNNQISSDEGTQLDKISKSVDNIFSQCQINQQISDLESEPITLLNQIIKQVNNLANNDSLQQMKADQENEFIEKLWQLEEIINKIKHNFN